MIASNPTPEAEGLEVVIIGSFNPAIFHPEWFLRQKLVGEDDVKEAQVNVVGREVADVQICGIKLVCIGDRFSLGTANISLAARMQDFLLQIFTLLPHTPLTACGINANAHYSIGDREYWHKIGHTLVPKELIWNGLLEKPGMQSVTVKAARKGEFPGDINITVEPSYLFQPGLFVLSNYHYQFPRDAVHSEATERLLKYLKTEWNSACEKARIVANEIFLKIKPENGKHT
jgi:hypothetical protein